MPSAGFEPSIPAGEQPQTHALTETDADMRFSQRSVGLLRVLTADWLLIQRDLFPSCLQRHSVYPTHWYAPTGLLGVPTLGSHI